ncbi:hypothetical protein C1645_831740 [Glomus cerebriforme]|uniref:Uncharacterized protein n=1 Tax=Glomus cerebriforme TaxID=658196 RepID=A0A397SGW7_9GLOM|nr:hypothetical protein C1645_831740 [Glomus cerebriforme]
MSLNQKSIVSTSAEYELIVIEDNDIFISSTCKGSTSTIETNDTVERIAITNVKSSYVMQNNDQQPNQKVKHKKKEFMPYIIMGHTVLPKLKDNIRDIMLYDVPGSWNAEMITEAINKSLGSLIKATLRKQGKYYSVRALVMLRMKKIEDLEVYQTWQIMLGDTPVRWFLGKWTLEMRKERLHHQAIIKNLADDLTEVKVYMGVDSSIYYHFKSLKIVKDNKGKRKLIGFFEKQADMITACQHPIMINNIEYKWTCDNYKQRKENKSNSGGKNNRRSDSDKKGLNKKKLKDTLSSKKTSNKKQEGSKQDSIADILQKL